MKYVKKFENFNSPEYLAEGVLSNVVNWMKQKITNPIINYVKNWKSPSIAKGAEFAKQFIEKNADLVKNATDAFSKMGKDKLQKISEKLKSFTGDVDTIDKSLVKTASQAVESKNESKSSVVNGILAFFGLSIELITASIVSPILLLFSTLLSSILLILSVGVDIVFIYIGAVATVLFYVVGIAIGAE